MNTSNKYAVFLLVITVAGLGVSRGLAADDDAGAGPPVAPLPAGRYACQVDTASGKPGLVLVQAHDKRDAAEAAAAHNSAFTVAGGNSPAAAVVQCIDVRSESFTDRDFQKFYSEMDL